jgi:hypothetical protein
MTEIALPLTGGCLCGACRYELRAAPYLLTVCHCTHCRRQSGSAFGMSMPAPAEAFHVTLGEPASFARVMPSGRSSVVRFCAACACRLFTEAGPKIVTLRPGTLDDTRWLRPVAQLWTNSALPWACLDDVPSHPGNAPDYDELGRAFRAQGIRFV